MSHASRRQWLLLSLLLLAACRQRAISTSDIQLDVDVSPARVGASTLLISARDEAGDPLEQPGVITARADMNHAGMTPILLAADESQAGVFSLPLEWSMAGDWILEVSLQRPGGDIVKRSVNLRIAGASHMAGMDHGGETSAVYLRIDNRGNTDATILGAHSPAADSVEFHRTLIENDVARMQPVEALEIPAGSQLDLRPGALHIMLRQLTRDLRPGETLALHLMMAAGDMISLQAPIMDMLMDEDDAAIEIGDLAFSRLWARPASHMPGDHGGDSE